MVSTAFVHGFTSTAMLIMAIGAQNAFVLRQGLRREHVLPVVALCALSDAVLLPYRGPVENAVRDILGGVRSTCTYVGASQLKELTKRTTFIRVREQENNVYGKPQN